MKAVGACCTLLTKLNIKSCKCVTTARDVLSNCQDLEWLNVAFCAKLDAKTLLPLPAKLGKLILDDGNVFRRFLEDIIEEKGSLSIYTAVSEYNKDILLIG